MPNLDSHLSSLRGRTLTADVVQGDTSLDLVEKAALLVLLGMRENSPRSSVKMGVAVILGQAGSSVVWDADASIPAGELQSLSVDVTADPTSSGVTLAAGGATPVVVPETSERLVFSCGEGEALDRSFTIGLPAYPDTPSVASVVVTYTYI